MSAIVMLLKVIAIILYGAFALFLVSFVRNHAQKSIYKWLTVIFVILLPTWDVVLGKIVYSIACRNYAKVAIYETAETEGIYYEGMNDYILQFAPRDNEPLSERIQVGWIEDSLVRGHAYAEARVTKKQPYAETEYYITIPVVYYRCTILPTDPTRPDFVRTDCRVVDHPQSRYVVKTDTSKFCTTTFNAKIIMDRTTRKILGEYKEVVNKKVLPFFSWLFQGYGLPPTVTVRCPLDKDGGTVNGRYLDFEFEVLKPKK